MVFALLDILLQKLGRFTCIDRLGLTLTATAVFKGHGIQIADNSKHDIGHTAHLIFQIFQFV